MPRHAHGVREFHFDMGERKNEITSMMLADLIVRRVRVPPREVVFLKGVIEASEGVAAVFAESGGDLTIATLPSQKDELDRILQDLREETGALFDLPELSAS